jgi:hypothetical protein
MSEQERPSTPSQPVQPGARSDELGSLPLFAIVACMLIGAVFGLVTVLVVWQVTRVIY